jgi:hypothetical protein
MWRDLHMFLTCCRPVVMIDFYGFENTDKIVSVVIFWEGGVQTQKRL